MLSKVNKILLFIATPFASFTTVATFTNWGDFILMTGVTLTLAWCIIFIYDE